MAKFIYKFEAIKQVKESLEKKAQKEVALIELEIDKLKKDHDKLLEEEMLSRKNNFKRNVLAAEIKFKKNYELNLNKRRSNIIEKINQLNNDKKIKLTELVQRSKEHKIFDTLEETLREDYNQEQKHIETIYTDELANQKFIRQKK
ncbi:MAG: flagellar export protein FliJ [Ignavibacteriaceae bacterium]